MMNEKITALNSDEVKRDPSIAEMIHSIRNVQVILDEDIARLYGVETRRLNEQVKRNITRFPEDFMFQLSSKEYTILKSQNATSSWGGRRKLPFAFTELGVSMRSSVLTSEIAIQTKCFNVWKHLNINRSQPTRRLRNYTKNLRKEN